MKRQARFCPEEIPVHIIQRGNNRNECFWSNQDKATYMKYLRAASIKYDVSIHAWVLMTNHVHLLVTPNQEYAVSRMMQYIGRMYVRYFNRKYTRTGTLWEGRFRSCLVQAEVYFLVCQRYIELNPVRARMVENPSDYHWSSYQVNALGSQSSICTPHGVYLSLGANKNEQQAAYRSLFSESVSSEQLDAIRFATNKGAPFGAADFKLKFGQ